MTGIIVPETALFTFKRRPFADLTDDDAQVRQVERAFVRLLERSYADDAARYGTAFAQRMRTGAEIKRRANILGKWFRYLRGDCNYSITRALDESSRALRAELEGRPYSPPERRRCWTPE